jgi:membrane protease YdiL (CAAX protease family)
MSEKSPSNKRKYDFRAFAGVMFAFVWPLAAIYISSLLIAAVFDVTGIASTENLAFFQENPWYRVPIDLFVSGAMLFMVVAPFYRMYFPPGVTWKQIFGLQRRPQWLDAGLSLAAYGAYFVLFLIVVSLIDRFIPTFDLNEAQELGITQPDSLIEYFGIFLILVVIPPVTEELIFRGYMFSSLRERISFWPTAILVSIAFAVVHEQWNVGVDVFILSMFLCLLREWTKSLWPAIFLHALKNSVAFIVLYIIKVDT